MAESAQAAETAESVESAEAAETVASGDGGASVEVAMGGHPAAVEAESGSGDRPEAAARVQNLPE